MPPKDSNTPIFKKEITLGQTVGVALAILTAMFTSWLDVNTKLAEHEVRLNTLEKSFAEFMDYTRKDNEKKEVKQDKLLDAVYDIKTELSNKENRK